MGRKLKPINEIFIVGISWSQIAAFLPDIEIPFNDWTQDHLEAGYSWRHESVSFISDDDGSHQVHLLVALGFSKKNSFAIRALEAIIDINPLVVLK